MTKIKFFDERDTDEDINEFMKDKDVIDVDISASQGYFIGMIIYKENEDE